MRTPDLALRERLQRLLSASPKFTSTELATALGVAPQSIRRLLAELPEGTVLSGGQTRRSRYALRRPLRGERDDLPLFAIDAAGQATLLASLALVQPQGTFLPLQGTRWPVPPESRDGWWDGLPYPIDAMRPAGYMGRQLARAESKALGVADDPDQWNDDDILWVLSRRGSDATGNLLLGGDAYDTWLRNKLADPEPHQDAALPALYSELAAQAIAGAGGGSSAAGEFPKFAAMRDLAGAATPHVLVKFSGSAPAASERRWGDLLVCEHLALEGTRLLAGIHPARSRIVLNAGRVFMEAERFDRIGLHGRRALCGLDALNPAFLGDRETAWPTLVRRLHGLRLIDAASVEAVETLWWYGQLIANSDMHLGNLSFHVDGTLTLAPVYDMLPMWYAPVAGGEVPPRMFAPVLPQPQQRETWLLACTAALQFWRSAAGDSRISEAFRGLCRDNALLLERTAERV